MTEYVTRVVVIAASLLCLAAAGCSSMTPEERREWAQDVREVEITRDRARVEGCELLGETSGVYGKNVRQQVARMKGNVALITGKQLWWNLKVRYLAEAYRCPTANKEAALWAGRFRVASRPREITSRPSTRAFRPIPRAPSLRRATMAPRRSR